MVKHNNVLPNGHFRKEWDMRVRTWLDQPMRKQRRRLARKAKAAKVAPRPVDSLRPVVRCQTVRYNTKVRAGKGFTLDEIKGAGLTAQVAKTLGVSVDHRRTNKSKESLDTNVARLKAYLSKIVVAQKGKSAIKLAGVKSAPYAEVVAKAQGVVPAITQAAPAVQFVAVTEELKKGEAFRTLRQEWINAKLKGKRDIKAKKAAEEAAKAAEKAPEA